MEIDFSAATLQPVLFASECVIKTTAILVIAAVAALLCRKASASVRHLIWTLGFACAFIQPLLSSIHSPLSLSITAAPEYHAALPEQAATVLPATDLPDQPLPQPATATAPAAIKAAPIEKPKNHPVFGALWNCAVLLWAAGAMFVLLKMGKGLYTARILVNSSTLMDSHCIPEASRRTMHRIPYCRSIKIRMLNRASAETSPLTLGLLRPIILLPASAATWEIERLDAVLLHELAHIRRRDWSTRLLANIVCALYWFHPLVWMAARKMRDESEVACDDQVVEMGIAAADYARHLLDIAVSSRNIRGLSMVAVPMASAPKIEGRLKTILMTGRQRGTVARSVFVRGIVATLAVGLICGAVKVIATPDTADAHVKRGKDILAKRILSKYAVPEFRRAVAIDPNNAEAQYQLGNALQQSSNTLLLRPNIATMLINNPSPSIHQEAVAHLRKAVSLSPGHSSWWFALGGAESNNRDYAEAVADYRRGVSLPHDQIGVATFTSSLGQRTTPVYNDDMKSGGHVLLGAALLHTHKIDAGIAEYKTAIAIKPDDSTTLLQLSAVLNHFGRHDEAKVLKAKAHALLIEQKYGEKNFDDLSAAYEKNPF